MTTRSWVPGFFLGAFLCMAGGGCKPSTAPPCAPSPSALSNQPLGGPCSTSANCASGLTCLSSVAEFSSTETPESQTSSLEVATNLCTMSCSVADGGGPCPASSTCLDGAQVPPQFGSPRTYPVCVPTCSSDTDCELGNRAEACVTIDGGLKVCETLEAETADAGVACTAPFCTTTCPAGFQRVDFECQESPYCGK